LGPSAIAVRRGPCSFAPNSSAGAAPARCHRGSGTAVDPSHHMPIPAQAMGLKKPRRGGAPGTPLPLKVLAGGAATLLCTAALAFLAMPSSVQPPPPQVRAAQSSLHALSARRIDGSPLDLATLSGKARATQTRAHQHTSIHAHTWRAPLPSPAPRAGGPDGQRCLELRVDRQRVSCEGVLLLLTGGSLYRSTGSAYAQLKRWHAEFGAALEVLLFPSDEWRQERAGPDHHSSRLDDSSSLLIRSCRRSRSRQRWRRTGCRLRRRPGGQGLCVCVCVCD